MAGGVTLTIGATLTTVTVPAVDVLSDVEAFGVLGAGGAMVGAAEAAAEGAGVGAVGPAVFVFA